MRMLMKFKMTLAVIMLSALFTSTLDAQNVVYCESNDKTEVETVDYVPSLTAGIGAVLENNISSDNKNTVNKEDVSKFTPCIQVLVKPDYDLYFKMLKLKIMTSRDLNSYLDVSEGIDNLLKKVIMESHSLEELILKIKTKRYTYNRLNRMFLHIVLGIEKDYPDEVYLRILGFNKKGQEYIKFNNIKENYKNTYCYSLELRGSCLYDMLTNQNTYAFEIKNQPIKKN